LNLKHILGISTILFVSFSSSAFIIRKEIEMILTLEFVAISLAFSDLVTIHMSLTFSFNICLGTPLELYVFSASSLRQLARYPKGSSKSQR